MERGARGQCPRRVTRGLNPTQDAIRVWRVWRVCVLDSGFWLVRSLLKEKRLVGLNVTPESPHCSAHVPCPISHIPFGYFPSTSRRLVISIFGHLLGIEERARDRRLGKKTKASSLGCRAGSPGLGIEQTASLASLACSPPPLASPGMGCRFVRCDYAKVV